MAIFSTCEVGRLKRQHYGTSTTIDESKAERVAAHGRPPARRRLSREHRIWRRAPVGCARPGPGCDRSAFDSVQLMERVRLMADTTSTDFGLEVREGLHEAFVEGDLRLPLEQRAREGDVGLALFGIVGG